MALLQTVSGELVAYWSSAYDFRDDKTGNQVKGRSRFVMVVTDPREEPTTVKFRESEAGIWERLGSEVGTKVALRCEVRASGSRVVLTGVALLGDDDPLDLD